MCNIYRISILRLDYVSHAIQRTVAALFSNLSWKAIGGNSSWQDSFLN